MTATARGRPGSEGRTQHAFLFRAHPRPGSGSLAEAAQAAQQWRGDLPGAALASGQDLSHCFSKLPPESAFRL